MREHPFNLKGGDFFVGKNPVSKFDGQFFSVSDRGRKKNSVKNNVFSICRRPKTEEKVLKRLQLITSIYVYKE